MHGCVYVCAVVGRIITLLPKGFKFSGFFFHEQCRTASYTNTCTACSEMASTVTAGNQHHEGLLQSYLRMQPRIFRELEAGGVAGGLAKTCVAPLERTKILFQTRRVSKELGIPGTLKFLWKTEGVRGLFRGNTASVLRISPYAAIHFSVYEHYRRFLQTYVERTEATQQQRHAAVQRQHVASMQDLEARLRNSSKKEEQEASAAVARVLQQLDSLPPAAQPRSHQDTRTAEERAAAVAAVVDRVMEESSSTGSSIEFTAAMAAAEAQLDLQAADSSMPATAPRQQAPLHPVWDLIAGSLSGATAVMITYPLDLVRTRLAYATEGAMSDSKANSTSSSISSSSSSSSPSSQQPQQSGSGGQASGPASRVASSGGASTSSSSASPPGSSTAPSSSSSVPRSMSSSATTSSSSSSSSFSPSSINSTSVAGGASTQSRPLPHHPHHPHHTISSMLREALQAEGPRGLYKGVTPTLLGILPYAGLKFYVYQTLKHAYNRRAERAAAAAAAAAGKQEQQGWEGSKGRLPIPIMLLFGGFAGLLAQTMTYPLDIVRRRMQVEGLSTMGKPPSASESRRASTLSITQAIIREDGARGLFRGLSVNYLKVVPSTAIGFTAYEFLKHYLNVVGNL